MKTIKAYPSYTFPKLKILSYEKDQPTKSNTNLVFLVDATKTASAFAVWPADGRGFISVKIGGMRDFFCPSTATKETRRSVWNKADAHLKETKLK